MEGHQHQQECQRVGLAVAVAFHDFGEPGVEAISQQQAGEGHEAQEKCTHAELRGEHGTEAGLGGSRADHEQTTPAQGLKKDHAQQCGEHTTGGDTRVHDGVVEVTTPGGSELRNGRTGRGEDRTQTDTGNQAQCTEREDRRGE